MPSLFRRLAASLLFCLFAAAFATPASAWRIAAIIEQEGIGPSGPTEVEGSFTAPGDKLVSVSHSEGYPDNSEIGGHSSVHLAQGTMRGNAHAVAVNINSQHQIRFTSILEEDLRITFPSTLPIAERIVHLRARFDAGFASTNAASATGFFSVTVNGRRAGASFGTNTAGGWSVPDPDPGWMSMRTSGGAAFEYTPIAGERDLELDVQLDGTASARGIFMVGTGIADVNALNTAFFELILPAGATFTSGSGVFLTEPIPEPGTAALVLAGACVLAARGRRERSRA